MSEVFGTGYSSTYDALYADKDYEAECDVLETLFKAHAPGPVLRVLDLGCGTGGHAIPLARRGYEVVGVDRSEGMLAQAAAKAKAAGVDVSFQLSDIRSLEGHSDFDAVIAMFAVIGYQTENADLRAALESVRSNLKKEGLFIFDFWYGPAVLSEGPGERVKLVPTDGGELIRTVSSRLDSRRQICDVMYKMWEIKGSQVAGETEETHTMRFFFAKELELALDQAGIELLALSAFPNIGGPPGDSTWNVVATGRAR
ncbi:MAG TPA: class I SAM-dependent methyltransferase [Actinomycetota bacterium]|nr:class I SAM-dependent methyltransferase [Actinomycetota bacterium]